MQKNDRCGIERDNGTAEGSVEDAAVEERLTALDVDVEWLGGVVVLRVND
jgi:hypothetical protein